MANTSISKFKPELFKDFHLNEHDACGIVAIIEKEPIQTKANIEQCIDALTLLNHRAGFIEGEGDGIGIQMEIPKKLWKSKLLANSVDENKVDQNGFSVAHIFIDNKVDANAKLEEIKFKIDSFGFEIITLSTSETITEVLGPIGKKEEPTFVQIAFEPKQELSNLNKVFFKLVLDIEKDEAIHVSSLGNEYVVYKVLGAGDTLRNYYYDLKSPLIESRVTLGHNRYSTNTLSNFFRVQPFSILGHNGEINTIAKLRNEAEMLGFTLTHGGSDSQDMNRILESLIVNYDLSLFEAIEYIFPPIYHEIKQYPNHLKDLYTYIREAWGHFAQGPAGIISRYKDEAVFSLDALGLRPLWLLETESSLMFSSEQGIVNAKEFISEPKPLSPGEKVGLKLHIDYSSLQEIVFNRLADKLNYRYSSVRLTHDRKPTPKTVIDPLTVTLGQYSAFGWTKEQIQMLEQMAAKGAEPIRSLGHDVPLAAIDTQRKNITDFIKESVAVVTNPAIDREREAEHFSTRIIVGKRPSLHSFDEKVIVEELSAPLIVEGEIGGTIAEELQQPSFEQLKDIFSNYDLLDKINISFQEGETIPEALERISNAAIYAVGTGKSLLILDDNNMNVEGEYWLDPALVVSAVHNSLVNHKIRRDCSLVLRSGAIRNLHDLVVCLGLGADIISPYLLFATVAEQHTDSTVNLWSALQKGLEKVISTLGIHEFRGYGRLFSAIGLNNEVSEVLNITNFLGSYELGNGFDYLETDSKKRYEDIRSENPSLAKPYHVLMRIWKSIHELAQTGDYTNYGEKLTDIETNNPTTIRHLLDFNKVDSTISPENVSLNVDDRELPFVISSMSFGSQNETPFRAYAEAADRLNMISLNGEGGEIKELLGKYPNSRGQQIASGRFGVSAELLNSTNLIELKIGQGAKPGEGGHLPGSKVTEKIAEARNATIGSDLISPSNNHDIYSIEDLAQMVAELKTANDKAKVIVKVPVVPNIGTIAIGVAKAGADYISLSGFDGGTGAARTHAIQHVGLPIELGVKAAHNALLEAGMRDKVEIWADGGVKSAADVMKLVLLGANRIGFGTLAMIAVGCTTCRGCHLDSCHVGIATQIETVAEATDHGIRRFVPREYDKAVSNLVNFFSAFGSELKKIAADLGIENLQEAVGKSCYLTKREFGSSIDVNSLLVEHELNFEKFVHNAEVAPHVFIAKDDNYLDYNDDRVLESRTLTAVNCEHRSVASRIACHRVRGKLNRQYIEDAKVVNTYIEGSVLGNGFAAYNVDGMNLTVHGGAQDGVGKTSFGGNVYILKTKSNSGNFVDGSVGKGFGYGATSGRLFAQGNADARAGIRLSGADLLIGGKIEKKIDDSTGNLGTNANIKGFAFEYMTNGRGLVLGDPGPWMCAGMTGGVVYVRLHPEMGQTIESIKKRIAKGAVVVVQNLNNKGVNDVTELLSH
ncbi:MAG: gltA-2, partial [Bacillales bacterium]|nr:gltA-2 [Bacillales bacterium]